MSTLFPTLLLTPMRTTAHLKTVQQKLTQQLCTVKPLLVLLPPKAAGENQEETVKLMHQCLMIL